MISKNLTLRLIVAAVFIPALLYVFHIGGLAFFIFVELLVVLSLWEFFTLTKVGLFLWQKIALILLAAMLPVQFHFFDTWHVLEFILGVIFLTTLPLAFTRKLGDVGRSIGISFFGMIYLPFGFSTLLLIRRASVVDYETAAGWMTFLFVAIWIIDTAAYYVGANFGKHKLSPAISPNKTVEGFLGGFAGAILTAGIFHFVFLKPVGFAHLILPGLVIAFFGQLGDLVESIFKREMGVKDSSNMIPGHGGILDRFDSLVFAAPALYLYLFYCQ